MPRHWRLALAALLLAPAWFAAAPSKAAETPAATVRENPNQTLLLSQPENVRLQRFATAIKRQGGACSSVIAAIFAGQSADGTAYWDARCAEGGSFRGSLRPTRGATLSFLMCGAEAPPPASGPCFQPVSPTTTAASSAPTGGGLCRAACGNRTGNALQACMNGCLAGHGVETGRQLANELPPDSRFGAIYSSDPPMAAYGFANGQHDRLSVNREAIISCQQMSGGVPCKFRGEMVNACGAVAMAISRAPSAMAMTADVRTQVLVHTSTATAPTEARARALALAQCRHSVGGGVTCYVKASGC